MRRLVRFSYLLSMTLLTLLATALFCWLVGFPAR